MRVRPPNEPGPELKPRFGYRSDIHDILTDLLAGHPEVTPGKMFGLPAFYTRGKLFACVAGEGVGLKLPEAAVQSLLGTPDIVPFQPYGKPKMREWSEIRHPNANAYADDLALFLQSIEFVSTMPERPGRTSMKRRSLSS